MANYLVRVIFGVALWVIVLVSGSTLLHAVPLGIFFDPQVSQHAFAANDIKTALETRGVEVELLDLRMLSPEYSNRKVVIALSTDAAVSGLLAAEGGGRVDALGEQAYALRTTTQPHLSYWVLGGDVNGAMYGGLQLAENISFHGPDQPYDTQDSPYLLKRGVKFNIPFDVRSPTYYSSGFSANDFRGTSTKRAIADVWDLSFWAAWFDEMARYRYNALSLWTLHPFTSMIQMPEYPDVALKDVLGFDGFSKTMTMEEKIAFWKEVMILAKNRGFEFYIINWNIYTYGATGKYGIDNSPANPATVTYMRKCITRLFETYPDLTGFGVTAGENTGGIDNEEEAKWMWATFGQGIYDYASGHKDRDLVFIHRYHGSGAAEVAANFKPLMELPNVRFDFSFKYAVAHIYSTTSPNWIRTRNGDVPAQLGQLNLKTWIELRNDDFYYLHWGDPDFVREYLRNFPDKDEYIRGFFAGSDGYTWTRVFTSKPEWAGGDLEVRRLWYTNMLWGRLAYNINLSDEIFRNAMVLRYPGVNPETLFSAWSLASKGVPLMTELVQGTWINDFKWWPEACMSRPDGFRTMDQMLETVPPPGSNLASFAQSAGDSCGDKESSYKVADRIESSALKALDLIGRKGPVTGNELETTEGNIRALSFLSLYYAEKIRGVTHKAAGKTSLAREDMGRAYEHWRSYSALMHEMYTGMDMQRTRTLTDWLMLDSIVRAEYTEPGGR